MEQNYLASLHHALHEIGLAKAFLSWWWWCWQCCWWWFSNCSPELAPIPIEGLNLNFEFSDQLCCTIYLSRFYHIDHDTGDDDDCVPACPEKIGKERLVTFDTLDQSDEETSLDQEKDLSWNTQLEWPPSRSFDPCPGHLTDHKTRKDTHVFVFVRIWRWSNVCIPDRVGTNLATRPNTFPVNLSKRSCRWNFNEYLSNAGEKM